MRGQRFPELRYVPYVIVPTFLEESARAGLESRSRRRQRVRFLYDVQSGASGSGSGEGENAQRDAEMVFDLSVGIGKCELG